MSEVINNSPRSFHLGYVPDRASLAAITIMEIMQDSYPDIAQSEGVYGLTMCRIARFLRDRDSELETDLLRQFSD